MKAAIYNPYWDTLGGGERYTASVASVFLKNGYSVDIEWRDKNLIKQISKRFELDISKVKIVKDINRGDSYDACFWVSDGSVPTLKSRNNFLHFQVPFKNTGGKSLINKMKLFRIKKVICNSSFTKNVIDREYGVNSLVIYPPVDVNKFKAKKKENVILYVGRFSQLAQAKNQHILISCFKKLYDTGAKGWKLILAGGGEIGANDYLEKLKRISSGYPISFEVSPTFSKLKDLYGRSSIFWSASGYNVDEVKDPKMVEHFGITPVEAMAAKCVPFLVNKGGHKEIVDDGTNGYLWNTEDQLVGLTRKAISDTKLMKKIAINAKEKSDRFSLSSFEEEVEKIL